MLLSLALKPAEKLINEYLKLDPEVLTQLSPIINKQIQIELTDFPMTVLIKINADNIELINTVNEAADTTIHSTSIGLIAMACSKTHDITEILHDYEITINGDIELTQQLKEILLSIDIDWEEYIAKITGDPIANFMGHQFRNLKSWSNETKESMQRNVTEYMQEESYCLPPRLACSDFYNEVDELRDTVERLSLKIQKLQTQIGEQNS